MSNNELKKGGAAIGKESDRKAAGRDRSDDTASDFDAGHAAGRDASDPNSRTGDIKKKIREEYKGLNKEERDAYRDGYASGSRR
jgi:hypothetical protein